LEAAAPENLARVAVASASDVYQEMTAEKAIDGQPGTRWSGIPGHNAGVWFELAWPSPQTIAQLVALQCDTYVMELDIQAWDDAAGAWKTLQHLGRSGVRLPRAIVSRFMPVRTTRLRLANITNGPSFCEIEVYAQPVALAYQAHLASDLTGHVIGIVTDRWGASPVAGVAIRLAGHGAGGPWEAATTSDANGLFRAPLPLGLADKLHGRITKEGEASEFTWTPRPCNTV